MKTLHVSPDVSVTTDTVTPLTHPPARASVLERTAMRLGLWLLLWGRHRSERRADFDAYSRHRLAEQVWAERHRADAYGTFHLPLL